MFNTLFSVLSCTAIINIPRSKAFKWVSISQIPGPATAPFIFSGECRAVHRNFPGEGGGGGGGGVRGWNLVLHLRNLRGVGGGGRDDTRGGGGMPPPPPKNGLGVAEDKTRRLPKYSHGVAGDKTRRFSKTMHNAHK